MISLIANRISLIASMSNVIIKSQIIPFSLPAQKHKGTPLHYAVEGEDLTSLHVVDFIIQNRLVFEN